METSAVDWSSIRLETLLEDGEFVVYRSDDPANPTSPGAVLVVMPRAEHPRLQAMGLLEHEHSLRDELDPVWAVRPVALTRLEGRTALILEDPGGELVMPRAGTAMGLPSRRDSRASVACRSRLRSLPARSPTGNRETHASALWLGGDEGIKIWSGFSVGRKAALRPGWMAERGQAAR